MKRTALGIWGGVILAFVSRATLAAQIDDKPFVEGEKRKELEQEAAAPPGPEFLWDWGGWLNGQYLSLGDEPTKDVRAQRFWDLRVWASASYTQNYRLYVRLRNTYQDWNSGDQFKSTENDFDLLRLDQGYVEAFWPETAEKMFGERSDLHGRMGRQWIRMGTGLLLNGSYDGLSFDGHGGPLRFKLFGAFSNVNEDDIDRSHPDHDDSHRLFIGAETEYSGFGLIRPSLLALVQRDFNDEDDPVQDFDYNSWYLGLGVRGPLLTPGLSFHLEADYEGGTSTAASSTDAEPISASALVAMINYQMSIQTSPKFGLSYIRATGDSDRGNPTDSSSGNMAGTDDKGFLSFGYLQSGVSLFPRISNIHIIKLEASCKPLESVEWGRSLEAGISFFRYTKDQSSEQITDPRSFLDDADVGTEIDFSLRWRVVSDVGVSFDFGRFMPGDAYDETSNRDFFNVSVTYSF